MENAEEFINTTNGTISMAGTTSPIFDILDEGNGFEFVTTTLISVLKFHVITPRARLVAARKKQNTHNRAHGSQN